MDMKAPSFGLVFHLLVLAPVGASHLRRGRTRCCRVLADICAKRVQWERFGNNPMKLGVGEVGCRRYACTTVQLLFYSSGKKGHHAREGNWCELQLSDQLRRARHLHRAMRSGSTGNSGQLYAPAQSWDSDDIPIYELLSMGS